MHNTELWDKIIEIGRVQEPEGISVANTLDEAAVNTICATMDFFGATDIWIKQTIFDLLQCRYRVFDWLAMCIMSRNDDNRTGNEMGLKVLVHAYLKCEGDVEKFIDDLRVTDYQIDESWEAIEIEKEA